ITMIHPVREPGRRLHIDRAKGLTLEWAPPNGTDSVIVYLGQGKGGSSTEKGLYTEIICKFAGALGKATSPPDVTSHLVPAVIVPGTRIVTHMTINAANQHTVKIGGFELTVDAMTEVLPGLADVDYINKPGHPDVCCV